MAFANPVKLLFAPLTVEWNIKTGNTKPETPATMLTVISKMKMIKVSTVALEPAMAELLHHLPATSSTILQTTQNKLSLKPISLRS